MAEHHASEGEVRDHFVYCLRCGYNLQGIDERSACPECGLLAGLSRLDPTDLQNNHPRWLRKLIRGLWLLVAGLLLTVTAPVTLAWLSNWAQSATWVAATPPANARTFYTPQVLQPTTDEWIDLGVRGLAVATPWLLIAAGLWMITASSRRLQSEKRRDLLRIALRLSAVLLALVTAIVVLDVSRVDLGQPFGTAEDPPLPLWGLLAFIPLCLGFYLRRLAVRAPAPHLALDSPPIGGIFTALLLTVVLLAAVERYFHAGLFGPGEGFLFFTAWLILTLTTTLWSILMLVRYAWAFGRSRRAALAIFSIGDKSTTDAESMTAAATPG